jgi:hypothetical protein
MNRLYVRPPAALLALALLSMIAGVRSTSAAGSETEFKAAFAAAETANAEAGRLRNQWTVTATALMDAKKAAAKGDFDEAIALSKEAEALAKASIFQARHEKEAWKDLVIR